MERALIFDLQQLHKCENVVGLVLSVNDLQSNTNCPLCRLSGNLKKTETRRLHKDNVCLQPWQTNEMITVARVSCV